jgi:hypothetical protein
MRAAACLIGALAPVPAVQSPAAPVLDCALGYEGLRGFAQSLAGATWSMEGGYDIASLAEPETWRVQIAFTSPGHPAHPTVTARTFRKQVTGVWTAESKGCGYGDRSQFTILMNDMKSGDTELTNASRHEVEARKAGQSPLDIAP